MIIGNKNRFGIQILSDDHAGQTADVQIFISGRRVTHEGVVFVPAFVGALNGFMVLHQTPPEVDVDFSQLEGTDAFALFQGILRSGESVGQITPRLAFDYYRMNNLDDAVDCSDIYVYDVADEKCIVWRTDCNGEGDESAPIHSISIPRIEFLSVLNEFVNLFHYR